MRPIIFFVLFCCGLPGFAQPSIGIGTTTPDSKAALDITSNSKGVLIPKLNSTQQNTLMNMLTTADKGMLISDANSGQLLQWTGAAWSSPTPAATLTAKAPLSVATNNIRINPGTHSGDLLTWDGNNWVNMQPAVQHFNIAVDNHQPYLVANYVISLFGIYPTTNMTPFVGEIIIMGGNFAPTGWHFCDGSLLPISGNEVLFNLIGTTYGGNGVNTFAVPDLRGRVAVHQGDGPATSNYIIGQSGGSEQKVFSH